MNIRILLLALALAGCGATKMSSEEAIRYQSDQLIKTAETLYASKPAVPDGDLTKMVVMAEGANVTTPNPYDNDSPANLRDADAMLRLHADHKAGTIHNEFGGQVKVIAKGGVVSLVYTGVPAKVSCTNIPHVTCERG